MALECPACGGTMFFNIKQNKLQCEYCDSLFDPEQYSKKNSGQKTKDIETMTVDRYLCKGCGAELCAPKDQIVSYCMYCGGESVLLDKAAKVERPESIIPFKISKEKAREEYESALKSIFFVPKKFSDSKFLEEFRGIYIPYWRTKVHLKSQRLDLEGKEEVTVGSTDYTRYYDYTVNIVDTNIDGGAFDASSALDDSVAATIAPFNESSIIPFKESYLAGFYADKASTPVSNYNEAIEKNACVRVQKDLEEKTDGIVTEEQKIKEKIDMEIAEPKTSLFPIWFLTWRKGHRVAYSMMNGETGKFSAEIPVDYGKLTLFAIIGIIIAFIILNLIPTFIIPLRMSGFSSYFLLISTMFLRGRIKRVYEREQHIFDLGNNEFYEKNKKKRKGIKFFSKCVTVIYVGLILFSTLSAIGIELPEDVAFLYDLMTMVQILCVARSVKYMFRVKNKMAIFPMFLTIFLQMTNSFLAGPEHPQDYWYLIITGLSLGGMILNYIICICYMNYMVTREAPDFYSRKGANNGR